MAHGGDWLVRNLAALWYRLDRRHRRITLANLEFAYGETLSPAARERLARRVFCHFVRLGWEICELLLAPLAVIRRKVIILGEEHMEAALAQGRGAVAIAAHAGNWEYTVMGYGLLCRPGVVVGRELDQPWAARLARYLRQRGGNYMVGKQKGMKGIMGHLQARTARWGLSSTRTPPPREASWLTFSATRPGPLRWRRSWPGGGCRSCPPCPGAWRTDATSW